MARVAIVTGGTRGIGEAISLALRDMGMTVAATYAGDDAKAADFTARTGIKAYKWDVGDYDACQAGCAKVAEELGPVDVVVNNAGITRDGTILKMTYQMWKEVMDTNLGGCFNMAKAVFPGMRERKWGRIVNIGSINGQAGQYGQVNYAAAKSGIHGFTKALAQEGAKAGVTVNAIAPGYIDTDMVAAVPADVLEKIVAKIPVGRLGQANEIARGVAFLCSEEGGFVTGSTLSINGGQHMYRWCAAWPRSARHGRRVGQPTRPTAALPPARQVLPQKNRGPVPRGTGPLPRYATRGISSAAVARVVRPGDRAAGERAGSCAKNCTECPVAAPGNAVAEQPAGDRADDGAAVIVAAPVAIVAAVIAAIAAILPVIAPVLLIIAALVCIALVLIRPVIALRRGGRCRNEGTGAHREGSGGEAELPGAELPEHVASPISR
jgi:acetoacetyl-CoA reductase